MLETQRTVIRKWKKDDEKDFFEYAKDPLVGPSAGWKPHCDISETRIILERFINSNIEEVFAIEYKKEKKVIGSFGISRCGRRTNPLAVSIGYVLNRKYWDKGIMSEVVDKMLNYIFSRGFELISVGHYTHNKASQRIIEKMNFKFEGVIRDSALLFNGELVDEKIYSLKKNEYFCKKD